MRVSCRVKSVGAKFGSQWCTPTTDDISCHVRMTVLSLFSVVLVRWIRRTLNRHPLNLYTLRIPSPLYRTTILVIGPSVRLTLRSRRWIVTNTLELCIEFERPGGKEVDSFFFFFLYLLFLLSLLSTPLVYLTYSIVQFTLVSLNGPQPCVVYNRRSAGDTVTVI